MEAKLLAQERNGWKGHFTPWLRSRSYVYCVSAQLTTSQRNDLRKLIETFLFQKLPQPSRLPITEVRLADWSDLRAQLNESGKVIDAWLGIRHINIASHQELLQGFSGFRTLLRQDKLDFIELDTASEFNPRRLYEKLNHPDGRIGAVLVGAGGIGKSRTAIEVATLADKAGWRVLHVQPGEPAVSCEDIETVLSLDNHDTLLVFDYLEQATLDFQTLTHRTLGEAKIRGQRVRLLGTARPSTLRSHHVRDALFERVEMSIDGDQQSQLSQQLVRAVAPTAIATLGAEAIITSCGHRPIIAVIIARDLERLAQSKHLSMEHLKLSPPGDLLARLRAQLDSHKLVANTTSSGGLLPDPPQPDLVLAAIVLATTPYDEFSLAEVVAQAVGGQEATAHTKRIIAHLRTHGWLDVMGTTLYSAHDVVADELLQRVFWHAHSHTLYIPQFQKLLATMLISARVLGRFSIAFSRIQPGPFRDAIASASAQWLADHAQALGSFWANASTDESAYALGATLDYPSWAETLIQNWDFFIQPWLDNHGEQLAARHLLYRGLKALPGPTGHPLIASAARWLKIHHRREEAGFVLPSLLERKDLDSRAPKTIEFAMHWLTREDRARASDSARYMYQALLERNDLGTHAPLVISLAKGWLTHENRACINDNASFMLTALLRRNDLGTHAITVINMALSWLKHEDRAPTADSAAFLMTGLLMRIDLGTRAPIVIGLALAWLRNRDRVRVSREACFVLVSLLKRDDLHAHAPDVIELGITWLTHGDRARIDDAAQPLLSTLLRRIDLGPRASSVINMAMSWLNHEDRARTTDSAGFLLDRLLERSDLNQRAAVVVEDAMAWLEYEDRAHRAEGPQYIFVRLLKRKDLTEKRRNAVRHLAIEWILMFPERDECSFGLQALLADRQSREEEDRVYGFALSWLERRHMEADAEFVLKRLLRQPGLSDKEWILTAGYACNWLSIHMHHKEYPYVLSDALLRGNCLDNEQREWLVIEAGRLLASPSILSKASADSLQLRLHAATTGEAYVPTAQLAQELLTLAISGGTPGHKKLEQALWVVQKFLQRDKPANAGFFIPQLLALSHRVDDVSLRASILAAATATASHPGMQPSNLHGLRKSALHLLDSNAWKSDKHALEDLVSTGLFEPVSA